VEKTSELAMKGAVALLDKLEPSALQARRENQNA
jgi:hypothetical protein